MMTMDQLLQVAILVLVVIVKGSSGGVVDTVMNQPCEGGVDTQKSRVLTLVVSHGQNSLDLSNSTLDEIDELHVRIRTLQDLYEPRITGLPQPELEMASLPHLESQNLIGCHDNYQIEYCLHQLHGLLVRSYLYVASSHEDESERGVHREEEAELLGLKTGLRRILCDMEAVNLVKPWKSNCPCTPIPLLKAEHFLVPQGGEANRFARDILLLERIDTVLTEARNIFNVMVNDATS